MKSKNPYVVSANVKTNYSKIKTYKLVRFRYNFDCRLCFFKYIILKFKQNFSAVNLWKHSFVGIRFVIYFELEISHFLHNFVHPWNPSMAFWRVFLTEFLRIEIACVCSANLNVASLHFQKGRSKRFVIWTRPLLFKFWKSSETNRMPWICNSLK